MLLDLIDPPSSASPTTEWQEFLASLKADSGRQEPTIRRAIADAERELTRRAKKTPEQRAKLLGDPIG
jgi:hypothetical protein